MKRWAKVEIVLTATLLAIGVAQGQTAVNPSGQKIVVAEQAAPVADTRQLNNKQKALADEADRLFSMATELNDQVSMTNKNILSVKVVRKAEEIEQYARRMKSETKK